MRSRWPTLTLPGVLTTFSSRGSRRGSPGGDDEVTCHSDALGSVRMITDAAGDVVARYDYLPFAWPS